MDRRLHVLHSVLRVSTDPDIPVRLFHLSFRDFLVDPERKYSQFWVDEKQTHKTLAMRCLDLLSRTTCLKQKICSIKPGSLRTDIDDQLIKQRLPAEIQYACRFWVHHLEQGRCLITDKDKVHQFLERRFLYWLEALSIIGRATESIGIIVRLHRLLEVRWPSSLLHSLIRTKSSKSSELRSLLDDAKRFILMSYATFNLTPLQLYSSAIIFAPAKSIVRNRFIKCIPDWLVKVPTGQDA